MSDIPDLQIIPAAQNSAPKKRGIPFKSKKELNGQVDERINKGGRPKLIYEETAKYLAETDKSGMTNAAKMVRAMVDLAKMQYPHSVSAFKEVRNVVEPPEEKDVGGATININQAVIQMVSDAAKRD